MRQVAAELVAARARINKERGVQTDEGGLFLSELLTRDFHRFGCSRHGADMGADASTEPSVAAREANPWFQRFLQQEGEWLPWLSGLSEPPWDADEMLNKWKRGLTGMPLVDANMRELAATGYLSHRGRQAVASYLTLDLALDWRRGADHFESALIDFDPCTNYGEWARAAAVVPAGPVERFRTVAQARRYDPGGDYLRYWLPELRYPKHPRTLGEPKTLSMSLAPPLTLTLFLTLITLWGRRRLPTPYLQAPWELSPAEQEKYGVRIGRSALEMAYDMTPASVVKLTVRKLPDAPPTHPRRTPDVPPTNPRLSHNEPTTTP